MNLLIVEDSPVVRSRLVELLQPLPEIEAVWEAGDVATARDAFLRFRPEVVILDLQLAEGSGLDVLQEIRRTAASPLVIVLTNHSEDHYRKRCLESGADFFLDKSKDLHRLQALLRHRTAAV